MEFFKQATQINFMAQRRWAAMLSILLFLLATVTLLSNGLHWGLDFTGGTQVQLSGVLSLSSVQQAFQQRPEFKEVSVVSYGTSQEALLSFSPIDMTAGSAHSSSTTETVTMSNISKEAVSTVLLTLKPTPKIEQINYIGPQVGREMTQKGMMAILIALLGTMFYIAIRFDGRFAMGAMVALIHDPIIILGIFSYFHLEFNLIALAAILTVIGYSLNDTIVIFDRVRENFSKQSNVSSIVVMNQAINQTLSRTIMTSALTLTVVLALFFLGGQLLYGFSLALIIGIIVGTYSSIYVAGSLALALGVKRQHLISPPTIVES